MNDSRALTSGEKQWLLAISRGPITQAAAERSIPIGILDHLIAKRLVAWQTDLLAITTKGQSAVALLRSL